GAARIDAIAEAAENSDNFVVAPSGIGRQLYEEVRSAICGVTAGVHKVIQTAARAGRVDKEVERESPAADGGLRAFNADADCELVPVLCEAETVSALPGPADDVLRIDLEGKGFLTVLDALFAFGDQAPHLAAGKVEAVIPLNAGPQLTLAKYVAVALAVVGSYAGAQEIAFVVAIHFCVAYLGIDEKSEA